MSPRSFLILAAVTGLAAIGAAIAIVSEQDLSAGERRGGDLMFPDLNARVDDVRRLTVETTRYRLVLERRGDAWVAADRADYPVRAATVTRVISSLAAMTEIDPKTDNPEWYQYLEVDGPAASPTPSGIQLIAAGADNATMVDVIVGKQSESVGATRLGGTFVRPTDDDQAWLAEGVVDVPLSLQGWFDQVLNVPGPQVTRVAILKGDEIVLDARKPDPEKGDYELTYLSETVGPAGTTANGDRIRGLGGAIVTVEFQDVRQLDEVEVPADARTVRYVTRDGLQIDATLGQADGETWVMFAASAEDGSEAAKAAQAINARTENWAFKLPANRVTILGREASELVFRPGESPAEAPAGAPRPFAPNAAPSGPIPAPSGPIPAPSGPVPAP
jgi:hypothetical protein